MSRTLKLRGVFAATATAILLGVTALAGCGDYDGGGGGYGDTGGTDGTQQPADTASVGLGDSELGDILVDQNGMTLYLFTADTAGTSTCYDECESNWPPLKTDGAPTISGEGLDEGLLGTTDRTDGSTQVTYNGHPLYYWASDVSPGSVGGQGFNDVWYVLDAEGNAITDKQE